MKMLGKCKAKSQKKDREIFNTFFVLKWISFNRRLKLTTTGCVTVKLAQVMASYSL